MIKSDLGQAIHCGSGPLGDIFQDLRLEEYSIPVSYVDAQGRTRTRKVSPFIVGDAAFRLDDALMTPFRLELAPLYLCSCNPKPCTLNATPCNTLP